MTLVDTDGKGVERITEKGVVVDGTEYELDCLIFATGFEVGTDYARRAGYQLIGRDGLTLSRKWRDGVRTLHGIHIHGFPNCFMMSIAQSGFTVNFPYMINEQAKHIAYVVHRALAGGLRTSKSPKRLRPQWVDDGHRTLGPDHRLRRATARRATTTTKESRAQTAGRTASSSAGRRSSSSILEAWRAEGQMKGLECR